MPATVRMLAAIREATDGDSLDWRRTASGALPPTSRNSL
jgi:hypothetical protein